MNLSLVFLRVLEWSSEQDKIQVYKMKVLFEI